MFCFKADIPPELCAVDDECKAIYHSADTICVWVFAARAQRDQFMRDTAGMNKADRTAHYEKFYWAEMDAN